MVALTYDEGHSAQAMLGGDVVCTQPYADQPPLMVEPAAGSALKKFDAFADWFRERQKTIETLLDGYGAIRWRGFGLRGTADFESLLDHYEMLEQGYTGGSTPRNSIGQSTKVMEATQAAPDLYLGLHQEMVYLPRYPGKIVFYCKKPAERGGETLVGDMRRFTEMLPARFVNEIAQRGIRYLRNFRSADMPFHPDGNPDVLRILHMTWQAGFGTTDRTAVEAICVESELDFKWEDDGSLSTSYASPGLVTHPRTGGRVWFNTVHSLFRFREWLGEDWWSAHYAAYRKTGIPLPYQVEYGDRSEIAAADAKCAAELLAEIAVAQPWHAGDVLMLDNVYAGHGRNPYAGTRDVQTALLA